MPPRKLETFGDTTDSAGHRAEHVGDRAEPDRHRAEPLSAAAPSGLDASRLTHLVGYAASRAAIEMRKVFARHMKPFELKVVEFSILMLVAANPHVNQKQIGQTLDISAPNMAVTLDRMVERGWVQRVRSEKDRRAQHIHLTAQGRDLVQRAGKVAATMEEAALRMLSAAERALLIELLLKVSAGKPTAPR
ncbi:MAG: MarR family transcriptional regulator [Caldimonas sp.]